FFSAARRMDEMCVRIDESGEHNAAAQVDLFRFRGVGLLFDFAARADRYDFSVANQNRAVWGNSELRKGIAAPRSTSAQREDLRCAGDQKVIGQGYSSMTKRWPDCISAR